MPTRRSPNDNEMQTYTEDGVEEIQPVFEKLSDRLTVIVGAAIAVELTQDKIDKTMVEVTKAIGAASLETKAILDGLIPESYIFGVKDVNDALKELSSLRPIGPVHGAQVNSMLSEAYLDFGSGLQGAKKSAGTILNRAFQEQLREKIYSGNVNGESIRKISSNVFKTLKNQGFTTFIRRDGYPISLQSYAEMLTRTHIIRAANEGTIKRCLELDIFIVQMSSHFNVKDEACLSVEGQIYDLRGKFFPQPPSMPIHPNCRHKLGARPDLSAEYYKNSP